MQIFSVLALTVVLWASSGHAGDDVPRSIEDLVQHYPEIFKTGNRNAASHLWSTFILKRAAHLEPSTLEMLFRGFCPVSGSPLPDAPRTRFYSSLPSVSGGKVAGITHHCCWPCICDAQSAVKTDTKTIQTASGAKKYTFLVIGDPCVNPSKLAEPFKDVFTGEMATLQKEAPEVQCEGGKLKDAFFSDQGHPIIGMFFVGDEEKNRATFNDAHDFAQQCEARQEQGFDSGMGAIFQKVAGINPIAAPQGTGFLQKWQDEKPPAGLARAFRKHTGLTTAVVLGGIVLGAFACLRCGSAKSPGGESDIE